MKHWILTNQQINQWALGYVSKVNQNVCLSFLSFFAFVFAFVCFLKTVKNKEKTKKNENKTGFFKWSASCCDSRLKNKKMKMWVTDWRISKLKQNKKKRSQFILWLFYVFFHVFFCEFKQSSVMCFMFCLHLYCFLYFNFLK